MAALIGGACARQQSASPAPPAQAPSPAGAALPSHPVPAESSAAASTPPAVGPILEVIDAASYTYVRVKTDSGEIWAVAPRAAVKVGDRVVIPRDMPAPNYHSQSLNRDFPLIYFATAVTREGEVPPPSLVSSHGAAAAPPADAAPPAPGSVKPAEGGSTVEAVWANSKALEGKTVSVRGKVVKFNGGILGRNWVHIQDGTGKPADGSNDLAVTTGEVAKVGDIVTVTGKLALNKDLGAGYVYRVIVEGATLTAK
jgi:hypothetical protein